MDCGPPRVPSWPPELIPSDPRGGSTNEVRPGPTAPFVEIDSQLAMGIERQLKKVKIAGLSALALLPFDFL